MNNCREAKACLASLWSDFSLNSSASQIWNLTIQFQVNVENNTSCFKLPSTFSNEVLLEDHCNDICVREENQEHVEEAVEKVEEF